MNLIEGLNTLGERINRWYPYINCGGCCVYASIIGKELRNRGIEVRVIVGGCGTDLNIDHARENINNTNRKTEWNSVGIIFNHVGLEFEYENIWYHYDTNGVKPKSDKLNAYTLHPGRLSVDEAEGLANESEGWNAAFDRSSIPRLSKHIEFYLRTNLQ